MGQATPQEIIERTLDGERLSAADGLTLLREGDLMELGLAADTVKGQHNDSSIATYNIDRNINYTNVCVYKCKFCAFYRPPGDAEGYLLSFEEIGQKIEETLALRGTGILLQGGVNPELPLSYYEELLNFIRENYPSIHLHAFSPPEVKFIARKERLSFFEVIARLKKAGLMSIPGGGAEILSDSTRKEIAAYTKCSSEEWIEVMRQAHANGLRSSSTMMFGVGEPLEARLEHLERIRDLQDETSGFTAFIGWTFQSDNTEITHIEPTWPHEYLKMVAVSRLFLDNIQHVQSSWVTQGQKIGQLALQFGADDMGSIMIEENVVASAGTSFKMSQEQMEHLIREAGYQPRQRTNLYERFVEPGELEDLARQHRGALTPENRNLASPLRVI